MLLFFLLLSLAPYSSSDFSDFIIDQHVREDLRKILSSDHAHSSEKHYPGGKIIISFVNGIYHSTEDWKRISDDLLVIFREAIAVDEHGSTHDKNHHETLDQLRFEVEVRPFYHQSTGWGVGD